MSEEKPEEAKSPRRKPSHVGAPAIFALHAACQDINRAFGGFGCYLVGSALERPDWRDVDVRLIMRDEEFSAEFPDASEGGWEFDTKWILLTVSISRHLASVTGLPIDFQFQPQTRANRLRGGPRHPLGLIFTKEGD